MKILIALQWLINAIDVLAPPLLVWRYGGWGILLATATLWIMAIFSIELPAAILPDYDPSLGIFWEAFACFPALLYACLLFAIIRGTQALIRRWYKRPQEPTPR
jgi:hypothetical protein